MRKALGVLLILLLLLIGGVSFYMLRSGWFGTVSPANDTVATESSAPGTGTEAVQSGADPAPDARTAKAEADNAADTAATQLDADSAKNRPTFDIVRAEADGSIIMAGRSKPGWTVIVESSGKEIGRATADENGEWIIQPDRKLPLGESSLQLSAKSPEGEKALFSKQRLALSLGDPISNQPLVALTEEGKATRVLQMPAPQTAAATASASAPETGPAEQDVAATGLAGSPPSQGSVSSNGSGLETATLTEPAQDAQTTARSQETVEPANQIGFASVDYEEVGEKSMLHLNGHAAPDARVALYVNNEFAGIATADATGRWSYSSNKQLAGGRHELRADLLAGKEKDVVARAAVNFERTPPTQTALTDDGSKTAALDDSGSAAPSAETGQTGLAGAETASPDQADNNVIIVKKGDTLWHIARQYYGDGTKYTQIFKNNQGQIRNPDWIYPDQRFKVPQNTVVNSQAQ